MKKLILIVFSLFSHTYGMSQIELWGWGRNMEGQIGLIGNKTNQSSPVLIQQPTNFNILACANQSCMAISKNGTLYSWGNPNRSSIGYGISNKDTSYGINQVGTDTTWTSIAADVWHCFGVKKNGTLHGFGRNYKSGPMMGQGHNIDTIYNKPQQIGTDTDWKKVSVGYGHVMALKKNGTIWAWGENGNGQLGLGHNNSVNTPTQIGTDTNWHEIAPGGYFSVAMKKNGTIWAWGSNGSGQLGLGHTNATNTPTQIGSDTNWIKLDASYHSIAQKRDGSIWSWGWGYGGALGHGNTNNQNSPTQIGTKKDWASFVTGYGNSFAIKKNGELWAWGKNEYGSLGVGTSIAYHSPTRVGNDSNWLQIKTRLSTILALRKLVNKSALIWNGNNNINFLSNWSSGSLPSSTDSVVILSGTLTINQSTSIDVMTIIGGSSVKLTAPLSVRNLYIKNGTLDLNGQRLTVTGQIIQSTDSANYYIQAGTAASPKPRSELFIKPIAAKNSTVHFNPNANRLNRFEIGNGSIAAQITLGNSLKIKGGEDGGNGPGLVTVNKNAKIVIPSGSSLTLESDTFNAGLSLAQPAQRSIVCTGTGKFNIERDHYGVRGWRLYSHPFKADIDLQEVANDIELIGSGGTAEGFYSNTYTNAASYWYDYSKADSSASTDPAWTPFTSAKGTTLSGNANKWKKNSPLLLFNPGNRRGTDAFGSPTTATYENGKITLSYTLDSTSVHLNDGVTQAITASNIPSSVPTNGLVGYWPFNGNAKDESGNGNNGTVNGATLTTDRNGNANSAYSFDGVNDGIKTRDNNFPYGSTNRTIAFWINNKSSGTDCAIPVRYGIHSPDNGCWILHSNSCNSSYPIGTLRSDFYNSGVWSNSVMSNNQWHFVAMTLEGQTCTIYLNGNNIGQGTVSINTISYFNSFYVGADSVSSPNYHFNGLLDDIAIWSRALTSSEIAALYSSSNNSNLSNKSKYFFITNPFTAPVKLSRIQGLNSSNVDPYFYYWKQRRNTVTDNFSPAEWQAEKIVTGTAARDSNISIPAFGTILVRLKNSSSTTFTIPESAKQLTNFGYIIGGAKGVSKTGLMFVDATGSNIGTNGVEIKLLVNDSQEADRVLIYNEANQSPSFTNYDAVKYLNQDFPNVYTLSADGKPLAIDMQDIKAQIDAGQPDVTIPLGVNRELDKRFSSLKWELSENTTGLDLYLKDLQNQQVEPWSTGVVKNIALDQQSLTTKRYALVFKQQTTSTKDPLADANDKNRSRKLELIAYPNPTDGKLTLKLSNGGSYEGAVEVYDMAGRLVIRRQMVGTTHLDISELTIGQYILKSRISTVLIRKTE